MLTNKPNDDLFLTFLACVNKTPDKLAVVYKDFKLSYSELETAVRELSASLIAQYLPHLQADSSQPVLIGVKCRNKLAALVCELAIISINRSFVPLNFNDPESRQAFTIKKSGISLILTDEMLTSDDDKITYCNVGTLDYSSDNSKDLTHFSTPNDLAYVLFTSGSTAKNPKGVMRTRTGLLRQMTRDYRTDLNISSDDVLLNLAPMTHDQAIVDCFGALLNGATLCMYDAKDMIIGHLHEFMIKNHITIFSSIPSMFGMIFEATDDKNKFPDLRVVTIGGEETLISHVQVYQQKCPPHCVLINGYGATEISWLSSFSIDMNTDISKLHKIPLGYPTKSVGIKLVECLDDETDMTEQPEKLYELCVSSDSLSPGYFQDDEATRQGFFVVDNETYYRTGDIVTLDSDNCLQFIGRKSWHEKIHGKRVNLSEVEDTVRKFVKECVIITHGEGNEKKIYAFYTENIDKQKRDSIVSELREILPEHMLPTMMHITDLPKLPNGKVDRQELKKQLIEKLNEFKSALDNIRMLENTSDSNLAIEGFWREALQIPLGIPLDPLSLFQDLGGDSPLAIWLTNKISKYFYDYHDIEIIIDPIVLYKDYANTYDKFRDYINNTVKQAQKDIPKPAMWPSSVSLVYQQTKAFLAHKDAQFNESIVTIEYDYNALKILVNHYNKLCNINIRLAESENKLHHIIGQFIDHPDDISQMGIIFFIDHIKDGHPIPGVLCRDADNQIHLLIADGLQGFYCLGRANIIVSKIKEQFPNINIRFDLNGRQIDINSCSTDTLLYLVAALQCNMLQESKPVDSTLKLAYESDHYYTRYILRNPANLDDCKLFISPPVTFLHSNILNIPEVMNLSQTSQRISLPTETLQLITDLKTNQIMISTIKPCYFRYLSFGVSVTASMDCNMALWEKAHELKEVVEQVLAANKATEDLKHVSEVVDETILTVHRAAETGDLPTLMSLIDSNPELIDQQDDKGRTPLMYAAQNGDDLMVAYLLENNANRYIISKKHETAFNLAMIKSKTSILELFKSRDDDIEAFDKAHTSLVILLDTLKKPTNKYFISEINQQTHTEQYRQFKDFYKQIAHLFSSNTLAPLKSTEFINGMIQQHNEIASDNNKSKLSGKIKKIIDEFSNSIGVTIEIDTNGRISPINQGMKVNIK